MCGGKARRQRPAERSQRRKNGRAAGFKAGKSNRNRREGDGDWVAGRRDGVGLAVILDLTWDGGIENAFKLPPGWRRRQQQLDLRFNGLRRRDG